jgi:solute carrier family 34 (sodium-dependent phosphate cotransporter)
MVQLAPCWRWRLLSWWSNGPVLMTNEIERKTQPVQSSAATTETAPAIETAAREGAAVRRSRLRGLGKVGLFLISLFLFILAITLMKEGARELGPLVRDRLQVTNAANSLGFGWLFAYVVMSGSPVAAAALTFFDAAIIDTRGAFAMITGSRLGASFIVLFIGFIYVLRGRDRSTSLSMGLLSLIVTGTTYLAGLVIGLALLNSGRLDAFQLQSGAILNSVTDLIFDPVADFFLSFLPRWTLFLVGLGIIILSFNLFDKCLPQMTIKESQVGRMSRLVYRPWVMFLLGSAITLISMSVSVSLSILVPLSQRGFVRRENVIPYIMGANITTFIDTLLAAVLLNNPPAFTIVLAEMLSITIVSVFILALIYRPYNRLMLGTVDWIVADNRNLGTFMLVILVVPVILLLF